MARRAKAKTVAQQALLLSRLPVTRRSEARAGSLVWEGQIQPTSHSEAYLVRIGYKPPKCPEISIVSPSLEPPEGVPLPHVYPGERLCLWYPEQWGLEMRIDTTIVPWAAEWLFYYELWLFTGVWHGGGHGSPLSDQQPIAEDEQGQTLPFVPRETKAFQRRIGWRPRLPGSQPGTQMWYPRDQAAESISGIDDGVRR